MPTVPLPTVLLENGYRMPFRLPPISLEEFAEFCRRNPDLPVERTAEGELVLIGLTESYQDSLNAEITAELCLWNRQQNPMGMVFGQSAGFTLPTTAVRSPDAAWIPRDRWDALTPQQQSGFAQICPDFVVELMSPSDRLTEAQSKMDEYLANGTRLGWLIDRKTRTVYVYRPGQSVTTLHDPATVSGDPELPGFALPMERVF